MQERSLSNTADEARGRMIQDNYYFEAKNNEAGDVFANQKRQLLSLWKADEATKLSLPEWETYKKRQWEQAKGSTEFLPWLYTSMWKNSGTQDDMFTCLLRRQHKEFKVSTGFEEFKKEVITNITKHVGEILGKTATQDQIIQQCLGEIISGLNVGGHEYNEFRNWQQAHSPEHFSTWMLQKEWDKSNKTVTFDEYKLNKRQELEKIWAESGLQHAGMDFDTWRKVQDPSLLNDTGLRAFIHCDTETRKFYRLESTASGAVNRNNIPYTTEYETTLHSGKGYAIFVVDSNQEIYAASHIPNVFHHSSFFADGAILAAGELRMGLDYGFAVAKDDKHKKTILKNFETNNKDAYKIQFIKNEKNNAWTIAGEDATGKMNVMEIPSGSTLDQELQQIDLKVKDPLSFTKRAAILDQASNLLGRPNPKDQITLLSSKSGHYHPEDPENYFMLKLWETRGVDLSKITFKTFGLREEVVYRSAQEYINQIEPLILLRQGKRLFIESGRVQDNQHQPLLVTEKTVVINKNGDCYLGDNYHDAFKHKEILKAKNIPGVKDDDIILKQTVQLELNKLNTKKASITDHIAELDRLIKQTNKSSRAKRSGRLTVKSTELSRLEKINNSIASLEKLIAPSAQRGFEEIQGGGVISINSKGEIEKIDTKIGDYVLSEKEIEKTLLALKRQGVKLDTVSLVVYDKSGTRAAPQNANQYLVDKHAAEKPKIVAPIVAASIKPQVTTGAITSKYRDTMAQSRNGSQSVPTLEEPIAPFSLTPKKY